MNLMQVIDAYSNLLWVQFQYDWGNMSNPWIFWTVIPELIYCAFFLLKWTVLLAPVTVPLFVLRGNIGGIINLKNNKVGDFQRN